MDGMGGPMRGRWMERVPIGMAQMAAAALFFSVMSVLVKVASAHLPASHTVMARGVVTLLMSIAAVRHARLSPWGKDRKRLVLRGLCGFVGLNCFYYSLKTLTLADASVIQYLNPVFAAVLAAIFLRERMRGVDVVCVLVSFAGVVLVTQPPWLFGGTWRAPVGAALLALLGAFASSVAYVTVRQLRNTDAPEVIVFYFPLLAVPLSVPPLLRDLTMPTPLEWLVLLGIGVSTQIAQIFLTKGLHNESAGRATAMSYLQVPFAYVWGVLLFSEIPGALSLAGTGLIAVSVLVLTLRPALPPRATAVVVPPAPISGDDVVARRPVDGGDRDGVEW